MQTVVRIASLLFACLALVVDYSRAAEERPNMVVFISDDHGYLDSQVAGNHDVKTPNMVRLADAGMTFTHAFAASPSCAPSRAALLTGLMPNRNGSMLNHQPPREDVKKLPAYLHELGYEVAAFGKVSHYKQTSLYGFDQFAHDTFHDHKCIPAALKFLRERESTKPLCLMVGTNWPHVPWPEADASDRQLAEMELPPTHIDTDATRRWRARYYAAVEKMDADLGKIYDAAYELLGENTLFIHFSDHGAQWPFGKWNCYDAGVRVPFFAVWPGKIEAKSQADAMISLIDVLPTLIEAAGGEPPTDIDGRSRLSNLLDADAAGADYIYATHSGDGRMNAYPMRSVRTERWKYIRNFKPDGEHHTHIDRGAAVDGNSYWHSWVEQCNTVDAAAAIVERYHRRPAEELYDLAGDSFEERNLALTSEGSGEQAATLTRLRQALDDWMNEQQDEGVATERAVAKGFKAP